MNNKSLGIHEVRFRYQELNENNTYYDQIIAAPSDEHRMIQWSVWMATAAAVALYVAVVFLAILINPYVRGKSFNVFLIFLMIPDFLFSFLCVWNCLLNLLAGDYFSEGWCRFQSFYCIWGIGANAWLNAVVAYHMHQMLLCSYRRKRYFPPSMRDVVVSSLVVYLWAFFVAIWPEIHFLPHSTGLLAGLACFPVAYSHGSLAFFFLVYFPCFALIPLVYVVYVWISVWTRKLLPKRGKTRHLAVYFFRLILVFIIMWLPSLLLLFGTSGLLNPWFMGVGGSWSHLQGAVSASCSILKPDIRKSVLRLLCCHSRRDDESSTFASRFSWFGGSHLSQEASTEENIRAAFSTAAAEVEFSDEEAAASEEEVPPDNKGDNNNPSENRELAPQIARTVSY